MSGNIPLAPQVCLFLLIYVPLSTTSSTIVKLGQKNVQFECRASSDEEKYDWCDDDQCAKKFAVCSNDNDVCSSNGSICQCPHDKSESDAPEWYWRKNLTFPPITRNMTGKKFYCIGRVHHKIISLTLKTGMLFDYIYGAGQTIVFFNME
jgi:hypothetical protein